MKKLILFLIVVVTVCSQFGCFGQNESYPNLSKYETYQAPPFPGTKYLTNDLYDYDIQNNITVPPTLTATFIYDIWQRIDMDNAYAWTDKPTKPADVDISDILAAFQVYMNKGFTKIAGYRPWTDWNFVRDLSNRERYHLAVDVVAYIHANGVWSAPSTTTP
jgi:hypothetical protein